MALYVSCDDSGRVGACAEVEEYAVGMAEVTSIPDEWGQDGVRISDFVYSYGSLLYDPLPEPPEPPDPVAIATEAKEMARTAQATAERASADIADYLDALLGLDETDETEVSNA